MRLSISACLAALALALTAPAQASVYTFNILYSGGGNASLAGGSDDPLATTMLAGDSFVYSLTAQNGIWNTISNGSIFPLFALSVDEPGARTGDFTLSLKNAGSTVFSYSENGALNQLVHIGTNTVSLPSGLFFDEWSLSYTILTADTGSTANALLPWPNQAPEAYRPDVITYTSTVPEPASQLIILAALGGLLTLAFARRHAA